MSPKQQTEHAKEIIRAMDAAEIGPTDALRIMSVAMQHLAHGFDVVMGGGVRRMDA
jgi:hypothetical protein